MGKNRSTDIANLSMKGMRLYLFCRRGDSPQRKKDISASLNDEFRDLRKM